MSAKLTKSAKSAKPPKQIKPKSMPQDNQEFFIMDDVVYFELKGHAKDTHMVTVSIDKWDYVSKYNWYLGKSGYPMSYDLGKMQLHRFVYSYILGSYPPSNMFVDHIDRNKLNNTNNNLRLATPQQNSFNKSTKTNKKGITKISDSNYTATIVKDGKRYQIKNCPTEKHAAEMYNVMSEELHGEFSAPNDLSKYLDINDTDTDDFNDIDDIDLIDRVID